MKLEICIKRGEFLIFKKFKERYCLFINERGVQTHIEDLCILSSSFQIE